MARVSLRIALFSLVTIALAAPAFAYNVVNTSWTVQCLFSNFDAPEGQARAPRLSPLTQFAVGSSSAKMVRGRRAT
jgi:hypothetical protein